MRVKLITFRGVLYTHLLFLPCATTGFSHQSRQRCRQLFDALSQDGEVETNAFFSEDYVDSYDPSVTGGCIHNLENHIRLLDSSLAKSRGDGMFEWIQSKLSSHASSPETAKQLHYNQRFGVLSHGTQPDPIYNYGNIASLELFEQTLENLCKTPSRYSTIPELMEDRSNLIEDIETQGYGLIDKAIRVSAKGNLFLIHQILVWTVFSDDNERLGLAAIYDRNGVSPLKK